MNKNKIISIFGCSFLVAAIILPTTNNVNLAFSQHSQHEVHEAQTSEVFDTVPVLLDGKVIPAKKFIHLYTSAPSKIATGHIQAHIPCDANGVSPLKVIGGMMIMPGEVPALNMTLDTGMSTPGMICMYHLDIMQQNQSSITDIALLNPTEQNITLPDMTSAIIHVAAIETGAAEGEEPMANATEILDNSKK
jgi:hypothetical protein